MNFQKKKKEIAQKMIQHTEYKNGKKVVTIVPQSKEHKQRSERISKHMSSYKEPSAIEKLEHMKKVGRAWND